MIMMTIDDNDDNDEDDDGDSQLLDKSGRAGTVLVRVHLSPSL